MEKARIKKMKADVCDVLERMTKEELENPKMAAYYKDLMKMEHYLCEMEDAEEDDPYEMGGSGRRGRSRTTGRYVSRAAYSEDDPAERVRDLMDDPSLSSYARESLRKAYAAMR